MTKEKDGTDSTVSRRDFLRGSAVVGAGGLVSPLISTARAAEAEEPVCETINVGFMTALTGPAAEWGRPGLTGCQMFVDEVNARGGLLVGGCRYPLALIPYDDEQIASKARTGAKELVSRYDVKIILSMGGAEVDAVQPYLTRNKVIQTSLSAPDAMPDRPYLFVGGDVTPRMDMLRPVYFKVMNPKRQPKLERWALTSQDDPMGLTTQPWEAGAAKATGWEVVYDKHFSVDTTDFAPVVTDILATKPDVVSLDITWPTFSVMIIEQLYHRGFEGGITANYFPTEQLFAKVPAEYMEGAVDSFPWFNDPWWDEPSPQHEFYRKWFKRFGPGAPEDVKREHNALDWDYNIMFEAWAWAAEQGGSFDPDVIFKTLREAESIATLMGPGVMRGETMYGIQNMITYPISICEIRSGVKRIQAQIRWEDWFENHAEEIVEYVKMRGQYWTQRK